MINIWLQFYKSSCNLLTLTWLIHGLVKIHKEKHCLNAIELVPEASFWVRRRYESLTVEPCIDNLQIYVRYFLFIGRTIEIANETKQQESNGKKKNNIKIKWPSRQWNRASVGKYFAQLQTASLFLLVLISVTHRGGISKHNHIGCLFLFVFLAAYLCLKIIRKPPRFLPPKLVRPMPSRTPLRHICVYNFLHIHIYIWVNACAYITYCCMRESICCILYICIERNIRARIMFIFQFHIHNNP